MQDHGSLRDFDVERPLSYEASVHSFVDIRVVFDFISREKSTTPVPAECY